LLSAFCYFDKLQEMIFNIDDKDWVASVLEAFIQTLVVGLGGIISLPARH